MALQLGGTVPPPRGCNIIFKTSTCSLTAVRYRQILLQYYHLFLG